MDLARIRLTKEYADLRKTKDKDIILQLDGDSLFKWISYIRGPPDSPFEDGWFKLRYDIGANYP